MATRRFTYISHGILLCVGFDKIINYLTEKPHFNSLMSSCENKLSYSYRHNFTYLIRHDMQPGMRFHTPETKFTTHDAMKSVVLIGDQGVGKTAYLSNYIVNDMFPWWHRMLFPARGLFLSKSSHLVKSAEKWLSSEIKDIFCPWESLTTHLHDKYHKQSFRIFLYRSFASRLPNVLRPQPTIIVFDNAEELLSTYRCQFMKSVEILMKESDVDTYRLVFIVSSENAVKALQLMYDYERVDVIQAPKVMRESVVDVYGEDFAKVFDACDENIGIALSYEYEYGDKAVKPMTGQAYTEQMKDNVRKMHVLTKEITREEYDAEKKKLY